MNDILLVAPAVEPLHLDEVRRDLRAPSGQTAQDETFKRMARAARRRIEGVYDLALVRQQRLLAMRSFPDTIKVPVRPMRAVQSITYVDTAGDTQTLASSAYRVDLYSGEIEPAYGTVWPSTLDVSNAVQVKYTAGYVVPISAYDTSGDLVTATGHDLATNAPVKLSNSGGVLQSPLSVETNYYAIAASANTLQFALTEGGSAVDITSTTSGTGQAFVGVVPEDIVSAMALIIAHLDTHREENSDFEVFEMPLGVENLMRPYKAMRF